MDLDEFLDLEILLHIVHLTNNVPQNKIEIIQRINLVKAQIKFYHTEVLWDEIEFLNKSLTTPSTPIEVK